MKILKIASAAILTGLGGVLLASGIYAPFNTSISRDEQHNEALACLLFGVPMTVGGIVLIRSLRQDKYAESGDRLNADFYNIIQNQNGRITPLALSMATGVTGTMAKAYLDERAKEFDANFEVDDSGNVCYLFNLGSNPRGNLRS